MAHEVETMAWSGQTPWHGLGVEVPQDISIDEMAVRASINWTVEKRPMYTQTNDGRFVMVPGRKALARSSDNKVLTVTGDNWHPVQNRDALEFFRRYSVAGGAQIETAGSLQGGKLVWALANLGHEFTVGAANGDSVKGYLLFTTSHQVGTTTKVRLTTVRVVCQNTLNMALNGRDGVEYSQNHLSSFDFKKAHATIDLFHAKIDNMADIAAKLQKFSVSPTETIRILAPHFQDVSSIADVEQLLLPANQNKALSSVLTSVEKAPGAQPGNAWGVLNGVTHWADHVVGRSVSNRLSRAWFGDTARIKQAVLSDLTKLAA